MVSQTEMRKSLFTDIWDLRLVQLVYPPLEQHSHFGYKYLPLQELPRFNTGYVALNETNEENISLKRPETRKHC